MIDLAERFSGRWRDGETLDIHEEMMKLTLATVAKTLFNADVESEAREVGEAVEVSLEHFNNLVYPLGSLLEKLPLPSNRKFRKVRANLDSIIYGIIRERRKSGKDEGDLLSMLLQAQDEEGDGKGMTDLQLRDEAMTLFLAGHETTANTLTWTWYLLSKNEEVEEKLHEEVDRVIGGRPPEVGDYQELKYTNMVLTESMRLYPPAWTIGREALNDFELGPYLIPAGSSVVMSQYLLHHSSKYFPEPERFKPERWTKEFRSSLPRYAYFPFGGGPRSCVGEPFAWMEGVLLLASIARSWKLRLAEGQRIGLLPRITLRPKYGMRVVLSRRQHG